MATKELPTSIRTYHRLMVEQKNVKLKECELERNEIIRQLKDMRSDILDGVKVYKDKYNVDLHDYEEFEKDTYIDGRFLKLTKGLFLKQDDNFELVGAIYDLMTYAQLQKKLYDIDKEIRLCKKLINLKFKEYTEILRLFYNKVQERMILEGEGYVYGNGIGWICINRVKRRKIRPILDYAATRAREKELIAQGKRIYNKEEADWCTRNGIEYKAEDKRVFRSDETYIEIPLISSKLKNGTKLKLETTDYRGPGTRNKTYADLKEECNNNPKEIVKLQMDIRAKLKMCQDIDKILYTKYIRNEDQKPVNVISINSKNR